MRYVTRLAVRLAWSPGQRRRQVLVVVTAALATLVVLGVVAAANMLRGEQTRLRARSVTSAADGAATALRAHARFDTLGGTQFPVVWLEVGSEDAPRPPGMAAFPPPGGWYVSPALAERMRRDPLVAARYPSARVLDARAMLNGEELLAYRRLPAGSTLGTLGTPVAHFGGDTPALNVGDPVDLELRPVALAAAGFVGIPLVLLVLAALGAAAPVRRHRLAVLDAMGMPRAARSRLVAVESAALAAPGVVAGAVAYAAVAPRLTTLPLVGRPVARGSLLMHQLAVAAVAALVAGTFTALGVLSDRRAKRQVRPRPSAAAAGVSGVRWVPLAAGAFLLVLSLFRDGKPAATSALGGVLLVAAGVPVALPLIVRAYGARMADSGGPARLLAGRRLVADPLSRTRPLLGLATILVIVPVAATWVANARVTDPPVASDRTLQSMRVTGALDAFDRERLPGAVPGARAMEAYVLDPQPGQPPTLRLVARCDDVARLLDATCEGGRLPAAATERLARVLHFGGAIELAAAVPPGTDRGITVVAPRGAAAESAVRAFALNAAAPLSVASEDDFVQRESLLVAWILAGMTLTAILTFATFAVGLVDRTAADARTRRLLRAIGLTRQKVRAVERREFLLAYGVVVGTGLAAGVACAWFWHELDPAGPFPGGLVAFLAAVVAALGGAGTLGLRASERADARYARTAGD